MFGHGADRVIADIRDGHAIRLATGLSTIPCRSRRPRSISAPASGECLRAKRHLVGDGDGNALHPLKNFAGRGAGIVLIAMREIGCPEWSLKRCTGLEIILNDPRKCLLLCRLRLSYATAPRRMNRPWRADGSPGSLPGRAKRGAGSHRPRRGTTAQRSLLRRRVLSPNSVNLRIKRQID